MEEPEHVPSQRPQVPFSCERQDGLQAGGQGAGDGQDGWQGAQQSGRGAGGQGGFCGGQQDGEALHVGWLLQG